MIIIQGIVLILQGNMYLCKVICVREFFIVTPIVGVCNYSMFCCTLLYVHSSFKIILVRKREKADCFALFVFLVSCDCGVVLPRGAMSLHFVIVEFYDHTHLLFSAKMPKYLDRELLIDPLYPEGILYTMMFCNYIIEDTK